MATNVRIQETPSLVLADNAPLLRRAFTVNAAASLAFGLLLIFDAQPIAAFLGIQHMQFFGAANVGAASIILDFGIVAVAFAAWVGYLATRRPISRSAAISVLALDSFMVADLALLLLSGALPLTTAGLWSILAVTDITLALAIWEYIGIRRMR